MSNNKTAVIDNNNSNSNNNNSNSNNSNNNSPLSLTATCLLEQVKPWAHQVAASSRQQQRRHHRQWFRRPQRSQPGLLTMRCTALRHLTKNITLAPTRIQPSSTSSSLYRAGACRYHHIRRSTSSSSNNNTIQGKKAMGTRAGPRVDPRLEQPQTLTRGCPASTAGRRSISPGFPWASSRPHHCNLQGGRRWAGGLPMKSSPSLSTIGWMSLCPSRPHDAWQGLPRCAMRSTATIQCGRGWEMKGGACGVLF